MLSIVPELARLTPWLLFPEITFPAPAAAPPIVFDRAPPKTLTPRLLGRAAPVVPRPMVFPCTTLVFVPAPPIVTPPPGLPAMTLRAAGAVPPTVFEVAPPKTAMPAPVFARTAVPSGSVPMRFPATTLSEVLASEMLIPWLVLPEITFPAPAAAPPTVLDLAPA